MAAIPESLRRAGIQSISDNIPEGYSPAITSDFVRIFRTDLEHLLFGFAKPVSAIKRNPKPTTRSEP